MGIRNFFQKAVRASGPEPKSFPRIITLPFGSGALTFEVNNATEQFRIAHYGAEQDTLKSLTEATGPSDIVFDVGASVGLMSIHCASRAGNGQVFAFEPDPENMKRLRRNAALNGLSNVTGIELAVSDKASEVTLYSDGANGASPSLREQPGRSGAPKGTILVRSVTIDAEIVADRLPVPDVMKIDVEGAEILVLRGARRLLAGDFGKRPRVVFLELHPLFLPNFGAEADDVRQLLLSTGYSRLETKPHNNEINEIYAAASPQ